MSDRWSVWKNRCRYQYRCCPEVWKAAPVVVDDYYPDEFASWDAAMRYVNHQLAADPE